MNRYQQELAEMDRRDRIKVRVISFLIPCALIIVAAWTSGFSPAVAWEGAYAWLFGQPTHEVPAPALATHSYVAGEPVRDETSAPIDLLPVDLLAATAASISTMPQQLHLVETTPGRNPQEGTAKLGTDPRAPQTYAAGAILLNGSRLSEIYESYVVLERDGKEFFLPLKDDASTSTETPMSDLAYVGGPSETAEPEIAADRLSAILRMSPVFENNLLVGMQIYPGTKSGVFHQLGLRAGDVVVAVESVPVFDATAANQLFEPLVNGAAMALSVRRGAQIQVIVLDGSIVTRGLSDSGVYASQSPASLPSG